MKVIITAGGTGGHIYPALAIINKIKEKEKNVEILYIGTHNRMEKDIVPKEGYEYKALEIYGFSKTEMLRNFKNIRLIQKAKKDAIKIMKDFKPDIVIGVGGYVTYPVLKAAKKLKIRTFIHEQNSIPGKTNKNLGKHVDLIGVSFKETIKYFNKDKCIYTGNPSSEYAISIKATPKTKYGLDRNKKSIVMVQGSLGSTAINNKLKDFLKSIDKKPYDVLYITGKTTFTEFSKNKFSKNVKVIDYVPNLASLLKDVDLVISRAGAGTISELTALEKPSILIPSPYVANNHQYYNAKTIADRGGSIMIEERDLNKKVLTENIDKILSDDKNYEKMKNSLKELSVNNSSTIIYEAIKKLINEG